MLRNFSGSIYFKNNILIIILVMDVFYHEFLRKFKNLGITRSIFGGLALNIYIKTKI